jgi:hypothetical protein
MKHLITIGEHLPQDSDEPAIGDIQLDIDELIRSKALIQGNSGAGKSGLIRVIAEQTAARIPTIIIDPESEFASLREKLDMVLVGDQGELKPDERSAGLLARKLAEMNASAILDIYELKGERKHLFVKNYIEALMALPRKLWRPTLIVMDEAQLFAPEKGFGDSEALEAVQDWMFRGRKHGLGSILATPRLSMLNKNVAGANNIFIGRTQLDVDQKRAGKALGMNEREAVTLRDLKKRQFYCFGPALNVSSVTMFYVATCETTIPEPGVAKHLTLPKASHVVSEMKEKLKDLEKEAEVEIRTLNEAKTEVAKLNRELKAAKANQSPREQDTKRITELTEALEKAKQQTRTETKTVEKKVVIEGTVTRIEKALERAEKLRDSFQEGMGALNTEVAQIREALTDARRINEPFQKPEPGTYAAIDRSKAPTAAGPVSVKIERTSSATGAHSAGMARPSSVVLAPSRGTANGNGDVKIGGGALRALQALATRPEQRVTRSQLATLSRMKASGGSFGTYMSTLRTAGFIVDDGKFFQITQEGMAYLGADVPPPPQTSEELLQQWLGAKSIGGKAKDMLILLWTRKRDGEAGLSRHDLANTVGMEASGGSFGTYLSTLRSNGLIEERSGVFEASDSLFI